VNALLIAGTDTDAGKTVVTTALLAYWRNHFRNLGIMKPIQSGTGDRELYSQLSLNQSITEITPLYFEAPLAPPIAAAKENRDIDLALVWQTLQNLRASRDFVLIEALGGLGSPVTAEFTVADLAAEWRLPTVLVVPVRLGAIAQAVANVALARQARVSLKGIILNCVQARSPQEIADFAPPELIQSLTNVPVLGCLPYFADPTNLDKLSQAAAALDLDLML